MNDGSPLGLFVYGTLAYDRTMRALTGRVFHKTPCVLYGYARITPPYGYAYIVPADGASVRGYLVEGLTREQLARIDEYEAEGDMYLRRAVTVSLPAGPRRAYAYVANEARIERHFERGGAPGAEDAAGVVAEIVEEEAGRALGAPPTREAVVACRELLGDTVEELIETRRGGRPLPREEMRRALRTPGIPTLAPIWAPAHPARPYADAYLRLAVRLIVFSAVEERIAGRFRGLVARPDAYFPHTISSFIALSMLNRKREEMERLLDREGGCALREGRDYPGYAARGIRIASRLFDAGEAAGACRLAARDAQPGATPLGAELEFSRLGARAIGAAAGEDAEFDGFFWAGDFDLPRRGWKLGLHVDTHRAACPPGERCRGFLEFALGRWKIAGDLSKPVTDDPRLLAAFVREATSFCGVPPHSLHLSLEIPPGRRYGPVGRLSDLLCLLLLGGDLRRDSSGAMREMRIHNREIEDGRGGLYFSRENVHSADGEMQSEVIEYQFPRLTTGRDYTPLIVAVKGFQLAGNPHPVNPFMDGAEYRPGRTLLSGLRRWAEEPRPLADSEITRFLEGAEAGLRAEAGGGAAHSEGFIRDALGAAARELRAANDSLR